MQILHPYKTIQIVIFDLKIPAKLAEISISYSQRKEEGGKGGGGRKRKKDLEQVDKENVKQKKVLCQH